MFCSENIVILAILSLYFDNLGTRFCYAIELLLYFGILLDVAPLYSIYLHIAQP